MEGPPLFGVVAAAAGKPWAMRLSALVPLVTLVLLLNMLKPASAAPEETVPAKGQHRGSEES